MKPAPQAVAIKAVTFDFDGTLVESNALKYDSFFKIFPAEPSYATVVGEVLRELPEASRYVALGEMRRRLEAKLGVAQPTVEALAARYDAVATEGASVCPPKKNAVRLLEQLQNGRQVFLFSTTPEPSLRKIVGARQWTGFFKEIHGYPKKKPDVLRQLLRQEGMTAPEMLVVGDGESDRVAAQEVGCAFFSAQATNALEELAGWLGLNNHA